MHNICFEQNIKIDKIFHLKIIIFTAVKYCNILHGRVCVMVNRVKQMKYLIMNA